MNRARFLGRSIMGVTRREFLKGCAAGAAVATLPATGMLERAQAAGTPDPVYRPLMEVALDTARKLGATYADMRVCRYHRQQISLRTQSELRTGRVRNVPRIAESESFGFGVRVLAYGAWGFAASSRVEKE
ncbi:MAG: twin-arginine translocation signal domain-containing protein, partial [Acidobacteriota bacterium]